MEPLKLPITFLTDYGYNDEFAGACRVVIEKAAPGAPVLDLTHGIPHGDVRRGALALEAVAGEAGPAVHLAVVDPGVGTERRGVAIAAADGSFFVGPDNGLLSLALAKLGGPTEAVDISRTPLRHDPVAPTFHGRDIFAPVAAHLASGLPIAAAGDSIDPATIKALDLPEPRRDGDALVAEVLYADAFGNLVLNAPNDAIEAGLRSVTIAIRGSSYEAAVGETFADGDGGLVLYPDSSGRLGLALDGGSAAVRLGVGRDDELVIRL